MDEDRELLIKFTKAAALDDRVVEIQRLAERTLSNRVH